jgi:hypothetical protein
MAGNGVTLYALTPSGNKVAFASGIDWRENIYLPNQINDNVVQIMADLRTLVNQIATGFVELGDTDGTYTPTYIAANQFRIDGADVSAYYKVGMRVRAVAPTPGTISGTISAVAYTAPNTLVTVTWDSTALSNEAITAIMIGLGSGPGGGASATGPNPPVFTACRIDAVSTSIVRLSRYNGYLLTIDNVPQPIPAAGVDLGLTGLSANNQYNVYAYMSAGGTMALEGSQTAVGTDPRNGLSIKSGDPTRSFVGWVYIDAGPVFMWSAGRRGVVSNYNTILGLEYSSISSVSTNSTTPVALGSPSIWILCSPRLPVRLTSGIVGAPNVANNWISTQPYYYVSSWSGIGPTISVYATINGGNLQCSPQASLNAGAQVIGFNVFGWVNSNAYSGIFVGGFWVEYPY